MNNMFRAQKVNQYRKNGSLVYVYRLLANQDADGFRNAVANAPLSKNGRPTAISINCSETGLPLYFYTTNNPLDYVEADYVNIQVSNTGKLSVKEVLDARDARERKAREKVEMLNALGVTKEQLVSMLFGQSVAPVVTQAPAKEHVSAPINLDDSI
jgi:hypothetical protein